VGEEEPREENVEGQKDRWCKEEEEPKDLRGKTEEIKEIGRTAEESS
jgi:hypothetical protein